MTQSTTALIVHGTGGSPAIHWFPWLKGELERRGIPTAIPQFPTTEGQSLDAWRKTFAAEIGALSAGHLLFGHSIGAGFVLNLLNRAASPVRGTFLVAGFLGAIGNPDYDPLNATFFSEELDWPTIRRNAGTCFVYAGDNDPYVALDKGVELAERLETELIVIPNGGHLNSHSGFTEFPRLLEDLTQIRSAGGSRPTR